MVKSRQKTKKEKNERDILKSNSYYIFVKYVIVCKTVII